MHRLAPYLTDREPTWFKIRNRGYSQWVGREELFERERERNPDAPSLWNSCDESLCSGRRVSRDLLFCAIVCSSVVGRR